MEAVSRRDFLAGSALLLTARSYSRIVGANDRIQIGRHVTTAFSPAMSRSPIHVAARSHGSSVVVAQRPTGRHLRDVRVGVESVSLG
jgi:hypothetical protein